jgi:hypothetical protein
MNVTSTPTPTTSKATFERALKQLDEGGDSFSESRHRPIVSGRAIASVKSQEQVLQDAADALASLWRNRKR